jgi:hypothetical protein
MQDSTEGSNTMKIPHRKFVDCAECKQHIAVLYFEADFNDWDSPNPTLKCIKCFYKEDA